jgi:hypothetical protein
MRRFTRLTNAFTKKLENHCHALALYFMFHNFCRIHEALNIPRLSWREGKAGIASAVIYPVGNRRHSGPERHSPNPQVSDPVLNPLAPKRKPPQFEGRVESALVRSEPVRRRHGLQTRQR